MTKRSNGISYRIGFSTCCVCLILSSISLLIIVSLITVYLPEQNVKTNSNEDTLGLSFVYGTDLSDQSTTIVSDNTRIIEQIGKFYSLQETIGPKFYYKFIAKDNLSKKKKRQSVDPIKQCQQSTSSIFVFNTKLSISLPETFRTKIGKKIYMKMIEDQIVSSPKTMSMTLSFNNNKTISIQLIFCSFEFISVDTIGVETLTTTSNTISSTQQSTYVSPKTRAMVRVDAESTVGILFDDIPQDQRNVAISLLDEKDEIYWTQMAKQQITYSQVRLIFRPTYYTNVKPPKKRGTLSLTLPKLFEIKFTTSPNLIIVDGHLLYARNFTFLNILITDVDSLAESDDRLSIEGGTIIETFQFPIDPYLIVQRTGYACMGEGQWPPDSVDPEITEVLYDDTCEVEEAQSSDINGCQQCHCSFPLPTMSCVDALKRFIGHVEVQLKFTRLFDNATLADEWRYPLEGPSVNVFGEVASINLIEDHEALSETRIIYRYIKPDSCEIVERCVEGSGWRRLLVFSTTVPNYGTEDLVLGSIPYFVDSEPSDYVTLYRIYEYSPCHKHFHFSHYGSFTFGTLNRTSNSKRGFCLQATYRYANAEWSVMAQNHFVCGDQGIDAGWSDSYPGGIPCQWIDVTNVNTTISPQTDVLTSFVNPDNFLCEGIAEDQWIPTNFTTTCCQGVGCCGENSFTNCCAGLPVQKQSCKTWFGATDDNVSEVNVTIPIDGEGLITADCSQSSGKWTEKRDCGFRIHPQGKMLNCPNPGFNSTLTNVKSILSYQIVRFCEASIVLNSCLACIWNSSLATIILKENQPEDVSFICTPQRDQQEIGGRFCIYIAPFFEEHDHNPNYVSWADIV